jgi:hypothetical protein
MSGDVYDTELLMSNIRSTEIEGATGFIQFHENNRAGVFRVQLRVGDGGGSFLDVGFWDGAKF